MILKNFDLAIPAGAIELTADGHNWDLHSCVDFAGFTYSPRAQNLELRWDILPEYDNPWGSLANLAKSCILRFDSLRELTVVNVGPANEDGLTVSEISKVTPEPGEFRTKPRWESGEPFNLYFLFENGSSLEVAAESAQLEGKY